ncbi:hypothetical protein [Camellia oleifera geminivirus]|nr:hypothetical protein [Camellia oleifera geminivirus]
MLRTSFLHTLDALSLKKKPLQPYFHFNTQPISNTYVFAENCIAMGSLISTCLSNYRANSTAAIHDSSIFSPPLSQYSSTPTSSELNRPPMSSPTLRRTVISLNTENSRSTLDLLEEAKAQLMRHTRQH